MCEIFFAALFRFNIRTSALLDSSSTTDIYHTLSSCQLSVFCGLHCLSSNMSSVPKAKKFYYKLFQMFDWNNLLYTQRSLIFKLINKKCDQNMSLVADYYTLFLLFSSCQEIVPALLA